MSIPNSRRGKILNNLVRQLQTITTGNGYHRTVVEVTTTVTDWRSRPEVTTPVLFVCDSTTNYKYHAGKLTERIWTIDIYGVMHVDQLEMESTVADIEQCLMANQRLAFTDTGAVASYVRIMNIVSDGQLFSEISNLQLFKVTVDVNYVQCVGER